MMLLAANSQRQLGHMKEAQAIYQQIIQKYPSREEAKDARYQRLIALYNANDPNLGTEIDQFLKDNPEGERADQAKLLKAEALYKEKDFAAAAPLYAGLRDSKLSAKLRAESAFKLGWCYVQTKQPEKVIEAFAYFLQAFPQHPQVPPPSRSAPSLSRKANNTSAPGAILSSCSSATPKRGNERRLYNKKRSSSGRLTTPKE